MRSTSRDVKIEFAKGGASPLDYKDVTEWVISDLGLGDEGIYTDGTPFGASHKINAPVGVADQPDVTLEGFFDDADDGPMDLFGTIDDVNSPVSYLRASWTAGSPPSTSTLPVHIKDFKILGKPKDITKFRAVLTQAGPIVHSRAGA